MADAEASAPKQAPAWRRMLAIAMMVFIAALVVWLTKSKFDSGAFLKHFSALSPLNAALALLAFAVGYAGAALRTWQIVRNEPFRDFTLLESLAITEAAFLVGYFAPIGGVSDITRAAYFAVGKKMPLVRGVLITAMDRALGLASIAIAGLVFLPLQFGTSAAPWLIGMQGLGWAALMALILLAAISPRLAARIAERVLVGRAPHWHERIESARRLIERQLSPQSIAIMLLSTALAMGGFSAGLFVLARALGVDNAMLLFAAGPLILFVQNFPFVYSGWGAREAAFVLLARFVPGFDVNAMLAVSVLAGIGQFFAALPGALGFLAFLSPRARAGA